MTLRSPSVPALFLVTRIHPIELTEQGRPFQHSVGPARLWLVVHVGLLQDLFGYRVQLGSACHRRELRARRQLEAMHPVECLADGLPDREQAVVAQDQRLTGAEIAQ